MFVDRRRMTREAATERAAAILPGGDVPCILADVNALGARLGFASDTRLPRRFELALEGRRRRAVRLVWQRGSSAGVEFESEGGGAGFFGWLRGAR